ncbi:sialidase family protein [Actinomadura fulvescens]|uniref:sialidase family protein n=1 Tax=Actinomadura fulvescens TaxID=46160 RepID=UPI0031D90266
MLKIMILALVVAGVTPVVAEARECGESVVYRSGSEGYHTFRIPAVVKTAEGTLLAFAEGRRDSAGDSGDIDLVVKRSRDGGCSWGSLAVVADHGADTVGNPSPVVDPRSGDVVLVTCTNGGSASLRQIMDDELLPGQGRRVWVQRSRDGGTSWSAPREITSSVKDPGWRWYATGPGHGLALRGGRLLVPGNHTGGDTTESRVHGGHGLISDDGGLSWRIGYVDSRSGGQVKLSESTAAQLPDGRIYVNAREGGPAPGTRATSYSSSEGQSLDRPFRSEPLLEAPVVQASVLQAGALVFAGPLGPGRARMTLRASHDLGRTWSSGRTLSSLPAAYSDLVRLDGSRLGVLYETGRVSPYETLTFTSVRL